MAGDIELDKDDPSSLAGRIWVGATVALIAFLAYSPQIWIIWPSYASYEKIDALFLLVPFNASIAILFWCYARCVTTDPGRVPRGWQPNLELDAEEAVEVKRLSGSPRFCRSCNQYKPPRSHHCRQCKRCVLRMDHHCKPRRVELIQTDACYGLQVPGSMYVTTIRPDTHELKRTQNCVGHHNTADFVRFLFWVDISCTYHLIMVSRRAFGNLVYYENATSVTALVMLVMNYVLCIPVLLAVGGFSFYHFWCLSSNTTTIEGWEKDKVAVLRRRGRIREVKYPYDLGFMKNISSVMGYHPLLWCWPQRSYGDGLSYRAAEAVRNPRLTIASSPEPFAQYFWPPRDQYAPHYQRRTPFPDASVATFEPGSLLAQSDEENSEEDVLTEEEDDIPLAQLKGSLAPDIGPASQRLRKRRGSEGYEIKPMQRTAHTHDEPDYEYIDSESG